MGNMPGGPGGPGGPGRGRTDEDRQRERERRQEECKQTFIITFCRKKKTGGRTLTNRQEEEEAWN